MYSYLLFGGQTHRHNKQAVTLTSTPYLTKSDITLFLMYRCNQAFPPLLSCSAGQLLSYGRLSRVDPSVCAYLPSWSRPCMQSTSQGGTWSLWGTSPHLPDDSLLCTQITHSSGYPLVSQLLPLSPVPPQPVSSCREHPPHSPPCSTSSTHL